MRRVLGNLFGVQGDGRTPQEEAMIPLPLFSCALL